MSDDTVLYRLFAASGDLLYVGITARIENRLSQHRRSKPWTEVAMIILEHHRSRERALTAESVAIRSERPAWNIKRPPMSRGSAKPTHRSQGHERIWATFKEIFSDMCHQCERFGTDEAYMIHTTGDTMRVDYECIYCGNQWFCSWGAFDAWLYPETITQLHIAFPPRTAWIRHNGTVRQLIFTNEMKEAMRPYDPLD